MTENHTVSAFEELQADISSFDRLHNVSATIEGRALDLVSEVGELSKELLNGTRYGEEPFIASEAWEIELGDVLYSLIRLANHTQINLGRAIQATLSKYEKRWERKGTISSDEREPS